MTSDEKLTPVQKLRSYVAHLEQENRRLSGKDVPSAAEVALRQENAQIRRQLAAETPASAGPEHRQYLTLPEVAQVLNVSTYEVLRNLRESLPMGVDSKGKPVVARKDLEGFLLARGQGRSTQRFL